MVLCVTLKAVMEVVSFRNVDICEAGAYRLEISLAVASPSSGEVIAALPASLSPGSFLFRPHNPAVLTEQSYLSASFQLSYSDEQISIGDILEFTIDSDLLPASQSPSLVLTVKLAYNKALSSAEDTEIAARSENYREMGRVILGIREPSKGVHEYVEVGITEESKAAVGLILHIEPVDWEYRPDFNKSDVPITLCQFLFPETYSQTPTESQLFQVHRDYLAPLIEHFHNLPSLLPPFSSVIKQLQRRIADEHEVNWERFQEFFQGLDGESIGDILVEEMKKIGRILAQTLSCIRENLGEEWTEFYRSKQEQDILSVYRSAIIDSPHAVDSIPKISFSNVSPLSLKATFSVPSAPPISISPQCLIDPPLLYHESYFSPLPQNPSPSQQASTGIHLYVFVPGYGSTNADLRPVKNVFAWFFHSNSQFLVSSCNDGRTDRDIGTLGEALAQEVLTHVSCFCKGSLRRISFIGHSLGGIIIRAALRWLGEYKNQLGAFVSLSCPHLGLMYGKSKVIKAGVWILGSFKRSASLKQLKMKDEGDLSRTALYSLSGDPYMAGFRSVLLFSSLQDKMVPIESARMELCERAQELSGRGCLFLDMLDRLLGQLQPARLHRILVHFPSAEGGLDQMMGRKAHIEFITNRRFVEILCTQFYDLLA